MDVLKGQSSHDIENQRLEVLHMLDQENGSTAPGGERVENLSAMRELCSKPTSVPVEACNTLVERV